MASTDKILITGIEGFTGLHLSEYLRQRGYSVYGISFFENYPQKGIYKCDIRQIGDVREIISEIIPDYIIHLAGISFTASENIQEIYSVNVQGSLNILDACISSEVIPHKIILASSATVYGNQGAEVLTEEMCPIPNSHYANSKLAMENMARTYFEKLPIMIVRPFNYTGQGQSRHFVIPKIVAHFKDKEAEIDLGNINIFREFNDVRYVIELYYKIMISNYRSDIVNICSGQAISLMKVIDTLTVLTAHRLKINVNPAFVRKNEIHSMSGSVEKLEKILGALPQNSPLINTLSKMLDD